MQITINKRKITLTVIAVFLVDLWLVFAGGPVAIHRVSTTVPTLAIILGPILIGVGIAAQVWTRGKDRYKQLNLMAYGLTLIWSMSYGFAVCVWFFG